MLPHYAVLLFAPAAAICFSGFAKVEGTLFRVGQAIQTSAKSVLVHLTENIQHIAPMVSQHETQTERALTD